ncbi:hypothetical protein AALF85_02535 [Jeotgalicoccus halotolerans]|uniref:hypothetical protein n=1 Tax=Jeotgalicoccus halotolerans TaxID=157227 RepID=UPI003511EFDD
MQEKVILEDKFINHPKFSNWESYEVFSSVEGSLSTLSYLFDINKDMFAQAKEVIQPMKENRYDVLLYHAELGMKRIEKNLNADETLKEIEHLTGVYG